MKQCSLWKCEKRHPKVCKHYRDNGYCKFTTFCKFEHKKQKHIEENSDKIAKIEKKLEEIVNMKTLVSTDPTKIDDLEQMVDHLEEKIKEKDDAITELTKRLKDMEYKFTNIYSTEVTDKFAELERKIKLFDKAPEATIFTCNLCEFSSTSEKGLKTHKGRMHTTNQNEVDTSSSYPKEC